MENRLAPYGLREQDYGISKVGKLKTSRRLAARMPSAEIAAKVGSAPPTASQTPDQIVRVLRLNARG